MLKPYNTWYYHLLIAVGMIASLSIFDIGKVLGIQTFKIPTTSNHPTLQMGDQVVADMEAYQDHGPDYGDLVVYSRPDGQIYTFRVVGLPKDQLALTDNIVTINGQPSKATFIKETTQDGFPVLEFEEELPNGHKHLIYTFKQPLDSTKTHIKHIIVPSDRYYLLGDNRDNAADSRYEGVIHKDSIKGQIIYSYWGQSMDRINVDFRN
ncbi:MAG: signal peptidase I [Bacteroidota bacterium]